MNEIIGSTVGDQVVVNLATTNILCNKVVPGFKIYPHDLDPCVLVLIPAKIEERFLESGGACQNYIHFPMKWQMNPVKEQAYTTKPKESEHGYNDKAGYYKGPNRLTGVILVSANCNAKDMCDR